MKNKYFWHFIFLFFVIICLANIYNKLKWNTPTDGVEWQETDIGLVCVKAPQASDLEAGDILETVGRYEIKNKIELYRIIQNSKRKTLDYRVERRRLLRGILVNITSKTTPISYYILVFSGLFLTLLTLQILNTNLKHERRFNPPFFFYLLSLTFSGFLIFSPTGSYSSTDFVFLILDRIALLFFPALLLHFSLYFPRKAPILRKIRVRNLFFFIYTIPITLLLATFIFIVDNSKNPIPGNLITIINYFRSLSLKYFAFFVFLALIFFLQACLNLIIRRKQKKLIIPLIGIVISIPNLLILVLLQPSSQETSFFSNMALFSLVFLPMSLSYFLSRRRFTDIEAIIKKTIFISSIFLFIFSLYFLLNINIENNIALVVFWATATIFTGGLLFRPIEETTQKYFERIFFKGTYNFKKKLKELSQSILTERNISSLAINFLHTINNGLQLTGSSLMIHTKKNVFYMLPQQQRITLSRGFQNELLKRDHMIIYSPNEFSRKFNKEYETLKGEKYTQFLPLRTHGKLIGVVAFGPKRNNNFLSVEDWELMFNITPSLTLSVENASLYSELESQLDKINLLKEFNENIILNINLGIVVLSRLNIINTWNRFMEIIFKLPASQAMNKKAISVFGAKLWKKISKQRQGALQNIEIEIKDQEFIFDIYLSPLKDNTGKIIGTILVFEDVTEKVRIQNQLITSEKMASLGLLSAGIAHEINTPLTGISSYCQLLLDNPETPDSPEFISKMQEQVQRANKIIRTLLDFSRQKGESPAEVDLNKTINESISLVEHKLNKKNIQLNKKYQFKQKLFGYSTRLQQLFINILINSVDAIEHNKGIITISGTENDQQLVLTISDNGKGIPEKEVKKIFDPFFTTKGKGEGTGLGLSISYNIIKDHYGDIKVDTTTEKGNAFIISFPLKTPLRRIKL